MNFRFAKLLTTFIIISFIAPRIPIAKAATDSLDAPRAVITSLSPDVNSTLTVHFGLPIDSQAIVPSDYIFIDLVYFPHITFPKTLTGGYTGDPVYSINNNRLGITGISLNPGKTLSLRDISVKNPPDIGAFDIYIRISTNAEGTFIRNQVYLQATTTDAGIIMKAYIPANIGQLRISGLAAPNMLITFDENNIDIGTSVADQSGVFTQLLSGLMPGEHSIAVYGTDSFNISTPPVVVNVFVKPYIVTEVIGVLLPPTIAVNKSQISRGEELIINGSGTPGYNVNLFTEPPLQAYQTIVNLDGSYSYTIADTTNFELGDHKAYSLLQDNEGTNSLYSYNAHFKVVDSNDTGDEGDTDCDISKGDLDCDNHVNLTDFSILLYYWGGSNIAADINRDGNVNLIDFSIMMFYWQT